MISAEDHPGIFYFLMGMIVLVLSGVGLSVVADKQFKISTSVSDSRREMELRQTDLADLKSVYDRRSGRLRDSEVARGDVAAAYRAERGKLEALASRRTELFQLRSKLGASINALETKFTNYRKDYRRKARVGAAGESLGELTVRGGRTYRHVSITQVTDVGLQIRHEHGIARIQAPDLDAAMQDRFQWNDEERRARLIQEERLSRGVSHPFDVDSPVSQETR